MKLIVGLGNPGEKYKDNRHNVGFMVIDTLVSQISNFQFPISNWEESKNAKAFYCKARIKGKEINFVRPQTFINNSGFSVDYVYKKNSLKPTDIYIIHDDLDIALGGYKIQKGKGPKEHKGLLSIYDSLGTKDFWHVRVGIENRNKESGIKNHGHKVSGEKYVLQDFTKDELEILQPAIARIVKDLFSQLTNH